MRLNRTAVNLDLSAHSPGVRLGSVALRRGVGSLSQRSKRRLRGPNGGRTVGLFLQRPHLHVIVPCKHKPAQQYACVRVQIDSFNPTCP